MKSKMLNDYYIKITLLLVDELKKVERLLFIVIWYNIEFNDLFLEVNLNENKTGHRLFTTKIDLN